MPKTAPHPNAVVEIKVPIHAWLLKRAAYEPGLRTRLEAELGRQAMALGKEAVK